MNRQVAGVARQRLPGLRVLFIAGFAEQASMSPGQLGQGPAVLTKPFLSSRWVTSYVSSSMAHRCALLSFQTAREPACVVSCEHRDGDCTTGPLACTGR